MINALTEILHSPVELFITLLFGFALGSVFFLSLWWVVVKGLTSERPAMLFVGSYVIRIGFCVLGFYFIADGNWQTLVISLVGFILARPTTSILIKLTSKGDQTNKTGINDAT